MDASSTGIAAVALVVVGAPLTALVLRVSCSICREEPPAYGQAVVIAFVEGMANLVVGFVTRLFVAGTISSNPLSIDTAVSLISLPCGMLIVAAILHKMVPTTTFSKAVLIWLAQFVVIVLAALVIFLVLALVFGGLTAARR